MLFCRLFQEPEGVAPAVLGLIPLLLVIAYLLWPEAHAAWCRYLDARVKDEKETTK